MSSEIFSTPTPTSSSKNHSPFWVLPQFGDPQAHNTWFSLSTRNYVNTPVWRFLFILWWFYCVPGRSNGFCDYHHGRQLHILIKTTLQTPCLAVITDVWIDLSMSIIAVSRPVWSLCVKMEDIMPLVILWAVNKKRDENSNILKPPTMTSSHYSHYT